MEVEDPRLIRAYAKAVYEAALESWSKSLRAALRALTEADLLSTLDDSELSFAEKQARLEAILPADLPAGVRNFLFVLARDDQLSLLPDVLDDLQRVIRRGPEVQVVTVTSAVPLTDEEMSALREQMIGRFGEDLDFRWQVDPELLGGVVIRVGDQVIDGSIAGRLEALRQRLV